LYEELTTAALGLLNVAHSRLEESRNAITIKREAGNEQVKEQWVSLLRLCRGGRKAEGCVTEKFPLIDRDVAV